MPARPAYVWLSSAGYYRVGPLTIFRVNAADTPVPGQFDADRLADPAIYQAVSGIGTCGFPAPAITGLAPLRWNNRRSPGSACGLRWGWISRSGGLRSRHRRLAHLGIRQRLRIEGIERLSKITVTARHK